MPVTFVTFAKVIPSLLFAPSLKPAAPVTVVVSAAVKPWYATLVSLFAVPVVAPVRLNTVLPRPVTPPVPVTSVADTNAMPRLMSVLAAKSTAPVTVVVSAAVKPWYVTLVSLFAVPVVAPVRLNTVLPRPVTPPVPVTSVADTNAIPRLVSVSDAKLTAPVTVVALLAEPKPV